jgi:hypothetical protein
VVLESGIVGGVAVAEWEPHLGRAVEEICCVELDCPVFERGAFMRGGDRDAGVIDGAGTGHADEFDGQGARGGDGTAGVVDWRDRGDQAVVVAVGVPIGEAGIEREGSDWGRLARSLDLSVFGGFGRLVDFARCWPLATRGAFAGCKPGGGALEFGGRECFFADRGAFDAMPGDGSPERSLLVFDAEPEGFGVGAGVDVACEGSAAFYANGECGLIVEEWSELSGGGVLLGKKWRVNDEEHETSEREWTEGAAARVSECRSECVTHGRSRGEGRLRRDADVGQSDSKVKRSGCIRCSNFARRRRCESSRGVYGGEMAKDRSCARLRDGARRGGGWLGDDSRDANWEQAVFFGNVLWSRRDVSFWCGGGRVVTDVRPARYERLLM